jgi:hypothetical protein
MTVPSDGVPSALAESTANECDDDLTRPVNELLPEKLTSTPSIVKDARGLRNVANELDRSDRRRHADVTAREGDAARENWIPGCRVPVGRPSVMMVTFCVANATLRVMK